MIRSLAALATAASFMCAPVAAFADDTATHPIQVAAAAELAGLPTTDQLPEGVVQVSPFIPGMGEHWANPANLPLGPIYCVMDGRVTCMEYMISQADFQAGKSFLELRPWFAGAGQPDIDHMEFTFMPHGHEGFEVPHFDVHMYFVSPQVRRTEEQAQAN
jgi:hypothetical protein